LFEKIHFLNTMQCERAPSINSLANPLAVTEMDFVAYSCFASEETNTCLLFGMWWEVEMCLARWRF
jgi:hypothetical protein